MRLNSVTSFTLTLLLLSIHLQAYNPVDHYTISCGATGKSFDGERTWTGDIDSNLLSHQDGTVSANATTQPPTIQVPYSTARLSQSQFNYSFPVTTGPKFLRLFFYPASYPSFPRTDSSFTVQANQYTLLNGFNASPNADSENTTNIFREYVININVHDGQRLNLSFTPSQPNSYAFINGIEVLSMPSNLYYTSEDDVGFKLVEHGTLFRVETSAALETEYRISIGGAGISPGDDTGLFRNWAGDDEYYLVTQNLPFNVLVYDASPITVNPDYVAPKELYRTGRDMGRNSTLNKSHNLTWEFPVDSGYTYVFRLHFCELDYLINDVSDRLFYIYIATELADDRADVMRWTEKQKGLAVYREYAVLVPKNDSQKKVNLLLQLHPYERFEDTVYSDPFLNGLEIFKISEAGSNNLAGPKTDTLYNITIQKGKRSKHHRTMITGVVAGTIFGVVFISFIVYLVFSCLTSKSSLHLSSMTKSINTQYFSLPSDLCRRFSLLEIKAATNNFDDLLVIGIGGFGHVYKGYIDGGASPVAVKRLKQGSQQGAREFLSEIEMLSQIRHIHLVSLVGYCNDNKEKILVYDLMTRGNLRDHLYNNTDNPPLSWKQRLQICIGVARGLHYLHTGAKHMIIHRDVKTTNILLDDKWVAKVSDFGLSRVGPMGLSKSHVSTAVKGSFGYLDPEYYKRYRLTEKSDVYSVGVVLFEILCARPPLIRNAEMQQQVSLANWVRFCYQSGTVEEIVDPTLKGKIAPECFKKFCEIGVNCLLEDGRQRPSMNDVVWMLEFALQLQESAEQRGNPGIVIEEVKVNENKDQNRDDLT